MSSYNMTNAEKQYDTSHVTNRLYVHWDVSTQCQFKCSYCYAMVDYGWKNKSEPGDWGKIAKWEEQKLTIKAIKRSSLPIFLGLQGGEPTIHPKYDELIELSHDAISQHELGRLYVTTNGLIGPKFFEKKKYYDRLMFLWSFHSEYHQRYGDDFYKMVESIKICLGKGHRCRVNIMLNPDKRYWKYLHQFTDIVEDIPGVEIHPHWIYNNGDPHAGVGGDEEFFKEFDRFAKYPSWLIFESSEGKKTILNDYELFLSGSFNFHDWKCWHNNYEISYDGNVHKACNLGDRENLIKTPFYFRDVKKIIPVRCPHTCCACDGHLKIYKER